MGSSDGTVQSITKILDNGPDNSRMNVVLVAEGFTSAEQATFNSLCSDFVAALQAETWYPVLGGAINVHRLSVDSDDSGTDEPATCADGAVGSGTTVDTYFDAQFCGSNIWRCLSGDYTLVRDTLDAWFVEWDVGIVLVNTTGHGGCASGNVSWTSVRSGWENIALHEMGHNFGLADEYHYYEGCGSGETGHDTAPAGEPFRPNITSETNRDDLKWRHLLTPGVSVPTMENPDCTQCDNRANVLSDDDAIGLFEGAGYYHCGLYRGAYRCRMRNSSNPFCRVCTQAIAEYLNTFIPATPTMEVEPLLLDFGDIAYGLTLYLAFEVRNVRTGRPGEIEVSVSNPTGEFSLAPDTESTFTLPAPVFEAHTSRLVFIAFTAVDTGGPTFSGQVVVTRSDDPSVAPITVNLQARAVAPPPVDSVLVIDRSGSMSGATGVQGRSKMDLAIEAANLYVSLLKDNDQIAIVRYNDTSGAGDVLLHMISAGDEVSGVGRANARAVLTPVNLHPDDATSIGAGIINGSSQLDTGTANARALVVLTDGRQNTHPDIPAATAIVNTKAPQQRVFAVGLGLNQLEDRLHQIASVTNGTAEITGDLVNEREFLLQKLYVQILSDVADEAFVRDPKRVANPGDRQFTTIYLSEVDVAADFIVVFRQTGVFPKYMRVELEAPDGTIYKPSDIAALPNAEFVLQPGHAYFRWKFPTFPDTPHQHKGAWIVWVENRAYGEYFLDGILTYSVMAKARSDLRLGGRVVQTDHKPGSQMEIILEPTLFGLPIELDAPVRVKITRPDGVLRTLALDQDEYGAYRATFADTGLVGPYMMQSEVWVTTPAGHRVTRFRHMSGLIYLPGGPDDWDGSGDELCREARRALEILHRVIERCCKERDQEDDITHLRYVAKKHLLAEIARRLDEDSDC
jgi:hypothetical protein